MKRKDYNNIRPAVPIGAEGENFLNFGPFFKIYYRFFLLLGRSGGGGHVPCVPTLNTLLYFINCRI